MTTTWWGCRALSDEPAPIRFLVDADLETVEEWRRHIANDRERMEHYLGDLGERVQGSPGQLWHKMLVDTVSQWHTLLVAALDARTAELTDEALGNRPDDAAG